MFLSSITYFRIRLVYINVQRGYQKSIICLPCSYLGNRPILFDYFTKHFCTMRDFGRLKYMSRQIAKHVVHMEYIVKDLQTENARTKQTMHDLTRTIWSIKRSGMIFMAFYLPTVFCICNK